VENTALPPTIKLYINNKLSNENKQMSLTSKADEGIADAFESKHFYLYVICSYPWKMKKLDDSLEHFWDCITRTSPWFDYR